MHARQQRIEGELIVLKSDQSRIPDDGTCLVT